MLKLLRKNVPAVVRLECSMLVITWNVNSLKVRLEQAKQLLVEKKPDYLLLQEIKSDNEELFKDFSDLGYNTYFTLQRTYNGVAILSPHNCLIINKHIPNYSDDTAARFLEVQHNNISIINVYVPNGNPIDTPKYTYKLEWLEKLYNYLKFKVENNEDFIIAGDFNIAPFNKDVYSQDAFKNDALTTKEVKDFYFKIINLGLSDVISHKYANEKHVYTWWDYRNAAFAHNRGMRIDHILLSPALVDKYNDCYIDKQARLLDPPSDHTTVMCTLSIDG